MRHLPGYRDCLRLIADAIRKQAWPQAGLYYPQFMIFPYAASRAWRDGRAREGEMGEAMDRLLLDLLDIQQSWAKREPQHAGAFPGGEDRSDHLSTALGLTTLLNLGRERAARLAVADRFDQAVTAAARYLIAVRQDRAPINPSTRARFAVGSGKVAFWDSGLFFSASFWDLGHWRSQAFTVAMVLEALTKYAIAYDLDDAPFASRRLKLVPAVPAR